MKKFNMIDEEFVCENCHKKVDKLHYVDIFPGDRQNTCHGLLRPINIEKYKNTYKIIYKCLKCNEIHKNIMATDDDFNKIILLSSNNQL